MTVDQNRLLATTDASIWASEFVKAFGGDEGLMIGWFANAIEVGRSAGLQKAEDIREEYEELKWRMEGLEK